VLSATQSAAREKLCEITVSVIGNGSVDLGWYPVADGETRTYITDTPIPLEIPEGALASLTGGTITESGILLTEKTAHLTVDLTGVSKPSVIAENVVINEVSVRGYDYKFVELYNGSASALSLDGWTLSTEKSVQYLDGLSIESGGYLLLGGDSLPLNVKLTPESTLTLSGRDSAVDTVDLFTVNRTVQLGRYPDGGEMITMYSSELTPGSSNAILPNFVIPPGISNGLLMSGVFYPTEDMPKDENGNPLLPLSMLESYFDKKKLVYRKEYDWLIANFDAKVPFDGFADYFEANTRLSASYVKSANVVILP